MADVKISSLPTSTTPLAGTEVLPIVQGTTTKQVAVSDLTAGRSISVSNLTNVGLTSGRVTYASTGGLLTDISTFVFDGINLGIGTTSPISYTNYSVVTVNGTNGGVIQLKNTANTNVFEMATAGGVSYLKTASATPLTLGAANSEAMRISSSGGVSIGNTIDKGAATLNISGLIFPQQASTAPTYQKGAIYFDTTLNKLRVGGATTWETITSV